MSASQKKELRRLGLAFVLFVALIVLEHSVSFFSSGIGIWVMLGLYMFPYLLAGLEVLQGAVLGIKNRQLFDEAFLMTLATIGAFATGEFEEAVAVMLFYQIGEFFQDYAVGQSRKSITSLMELAPDYANLLHPDGSSEQIDPEDVREGMQLLVLPGEKIPVDGIVLEGESLVNTAALTGEPVPRSVRAGGTVISGCINGEGLLKIEAQKCYEDSTVARILELVENAAARKSRTENFITRFSRYYTPLVVIGALLLALVPPIFVGQWQVWILRACTFLVISCPCALVISVPLAFFGGIGAASRAGILVKGSNYLELLAQLDTVVMDKTGTLTRGEFTVTALYPATGVSESELLGAAATAEGSSTHPIARSIREAAAETGIAVGVPRRAENRTGRGLIAWTDTAQLCVGNEQLMTEAGIEFTARQEAGGTLVYVGRDGAYLGCIRIEDRVKPEAGESLQALRNEGVRRLWMLSGDRKGAVEAVAEALKLDGADSDLLPADKLERMEQLLKEVGEGRKLAYLGDGINDAPVLSRADVGIAMGSMGSDAAIEAADIVIMDDRLNRLPLVIRIARKTMRIAKENIIFALGVKLLILLLGALGLANMWAAVFADVGVAVLAILNAMRMLGHTK